MTNAQIIYNAQMELLEQGKIKSTGKMFKAIDGEGNEILVPEPEEIHTYAAWKSLGFQVRKGQKAVASFTIWKHTVKKAKTEDEEDEPKMFMKMSSFFSRSQVEAITA